MLQKDVDLQKALSDFFGFQTFKGNQEEIIKSVMRGEDSFIIMPTGAGKSLCYQLPALIKEGTAIIISPLIALMKNQVDQIRGFGENDSIAHFLNSSLSKTDSTRVKEDVISGKTKMLYVAPETLKKEETVEFLKQVKVSFVAVDEAHCISEWGHDFRPEYRRIKQIIKAIGDVPMMALTATATPKVQSDIQKNLDMNDALLFQSSFNRTNLYYEIRAKGKKDKTLKEIINFINRHKGKSGIIYCLSRKKVEYLAEVLRANGINARPYHAGLDSKTRVANQDAFLMENADVIVATIAFGMGIDKPDVRFVIHYDVPKSLEGYYQETGRAGRDGLVGDCLLFYNPSDIEKLEKFMKDKGVAEQEIGSQLIFEMSSFAESSQCRRKILLHYFGENFDEDLCNNMCDNCRHPKTLISVTEEFTEMLKWVQICGGRVNLDHIVNVLIGKKTQEVTAYKHHLNELFGCMSDKDYNFCKSLVRVALLRNLISKNIEKYGLLSINPEGEEFIKNPEKVQIAMDTEYEKISDEDFESPDNEVAVVFDVELFALLKDLQRQIAKEKGLPPYVIFQETSLEDMAAKYPITLEELEGISGVGKNKAKKYGEPFIAIIAEYVEENEIERLQDLIVKTTGSRSNKKIALIQNLDKKYSLTDISKSTGLTVPEVLQEVEDIIYSGTKLDLHYMIDEIMDDEVKEEIYEYFRTHEDNDLDLAVRAFDGDFEHDEMHLVRIQFISDVAN